MQLTGGSITLISVTISNPMTLDYYGNNTTAPNIDFDKYRGTSTSPLIIVTGDELGVINFRGYDTDSLVTGAAIKGISAGTIADSRIPAVLEFWTGTDAAPTALTKRLTIDDVGKLTVVGGANADKITVTAGDIKMTLGDIRLTNGIFTGDLTTNQGNYLKRDQAVTTVPLLELETTNAADDQPALLVDYNATGAVNAVEIQNSGTGYALAISVDTSTAVKGISVDFSGVNSVTTPAIKVALGRWTGTANEGGVWIINTVAADVVAGQMLRVHQQATGQHAAAIDGSTLFIKDAAAAPAAGTSYAVSIDATNIEALHVVTGLARFDEGASLGNATDSWLRTDTIEISNAEIKTLRAAVKTLVAAPGADYFIEVVALVLILDYGTNVLTESETGDNLVLRYNAAATDIAGTIEMTGFIDAAADTIKFVRPAIEDISAATCVNKAVELFNSGVGEFGGNAAADTTMTVKITYRIHKAGL